MRLSFQILLLFLWIFLGCFNKQPKEKILDPNINIGFIETVKANSKYNFTKIKMDTLSAEHFKEIPFPFFKKYYSSKLSNSTDDFSTPPNDNIYWRFSFLGFEKGQYFDFQTIIGYFEEEGIFLYLVKIDKKSNEVLTIDEIAYYGGDGGYFESDISIKENAQTFRNMHTVGETDESTLVEDTLITNLNIFDIRINVLKNGKLKIDTIKSTKRVEKQFSGSN